MDDAYHRVTVTTPAEFRSQFRVLVLEERHARVEFVVTRGINNSTYLDMEGRIERNNAAKGRVDRIANPRTILPAAERPKIKIRYHHELRANYNERGTNWIAVIPPGQKRPMYGTNMVSRESNPLCLQAMQMGVAFEIGSSDDDDDDDDDDEDDE